MTAGARFGQLRFRVRAGARSAVAASPCWACGRWAAAELVGARWEQVSNPRSRLVSSCGPRYRRVLGEAALSEGTGTDSTAESISEVHCSQKDPIAFESPQTPVLTETYYDHRVAFGKRLAETGKSKTATAAAVNTYKGCTHAFLNLHTRPNFSHWTHRG